MDNIIIIIISFWEFWLSLERCHIIFLYQGNCKELSFPQDTKQGRGQLDYT